MAIWVHFRKILPWILCVLAILIEFFLIRKTIGEGTGTTIPLHYNIIVGVDSFGSSNNLWRIPISGMFVFVFNLCFGKLMRLDNFQKQLLGYIAALFSLVTLFGLCLLLYWL